MENKGRRNITDKQADLIKELFKEEISKYKNMSFGQLGQIKQALNRAFRKAKLINNGLSFSKKDLQLRKIVRLRDKENLSWHSIADAIGGISHTTVQKMYEEYKLLINRKYIQYDHDK